ncbi:LysR family transcriptional regulator [Salmonella enterica subsp. enterica]|nr:LysR family transcriptional regulator [Salmonella enterica]EBY0806490.1 LysR family transcriptional regulator [Salmonella enterica subsp. enterica serovar Berlin]ECF3780256.1 LysR family transcriptional regulator [Salmonella enterica subsp. enterica serovar Oslo]EDR2105141.1 LysR family transcriptional regulator [Salmonella enterica subsp. enterica]EDW0613062.1 LysR family transcriptional regulator [Salmonella enterica subsp. enterica serovar Ball]EGZ4377612.1 LysR family transcriptional re
MAISHAQLKAFHAVAVYGSFTLAAERLFLSQPAISDQVKKLEEKYGIQLFTRNKRKVTLTDAGERLLVITEKMFTIEAEAEKLLQGSTKMSSGSLALAVDSSRHLANYISLFCERYPGITINLLTGNSEESLRRLTNHQVDVAVIGKPFSDPNFVSVLLTTCPVVAFVGQQHPFSKQESIVLADLSHQPLVLRERGSATRQLVDEALLHAQIETGLCIEVVGREAANDLVGNGIGIGFISSSEFNYDPRLVLLPINDVHIVMHETLLCLQKNRNQRITSAFMALVREQQQLNLHVDQ